MMRPARALAAAGFPFAYLVHTSTEGERMPQEWDGNLTLLVEREVMDVSMSAERLPGYDLIDLEALSFQFLRFVYDVAERF